ncbi:MAG: hypothetical protein KAJ31_05065 [Deltaproteobacteria bacterium]|nr:hypothetical protein [Deltaproteobacteria bacterium]MCK5709977.1 hypothetical protein [Deltaproteobacteria bacterium]
MNVKNTLTPRTLRIEIWKKDNMEWSLQGDGSTIQYQQAAIKIRSLFKGEDELKLVRNKDNVSTVSKEGALEVIKNSLSNDNLMLCDEKFTRMMVFFYLSKVK